MGRQIDTVAQSLRATVTGRRLTSAGAMIALISAMVAVLIAGSAYIGYEQDELQELRETARAKRLARQALMETDSAVLNLLAHPQHRADLQPFVRALAKLSAHPAASFPASVTRNKTEVPTADLLALLKADWAAVVADVTQGRLEQARAFYGAQATQQAMADLVAEFRETLDGLEKTFAANNRRLDQVMLALLLLQIVAGLVCILAFHFAARKGSEESKARARAVKSANASREQVARLFEMADMLQSASDHTDANAVLKATASDLIAGYGGALYVFNNSRDRLVLSTSWDRDGYEPLPDALSLTQCWALKRGKPHLNRPHSRKLSCEHHVSRDFALEIPMIARGEILGLLQIYADGADAEQRLAQVASLGAALADAMSLALSNIALREKLRSQALRDPLTGLYNRRYMEDTLQRFVRLAEREQREVAVIMIDLDHFKRLNDQHGHAKGDAVLRDSAALLTNQLRETDVACRYGGEELIILLPDCGLEMAAAKAESIRRSIETLSEANGPQVSASIGVASIPRTSATMSDLVAHADAALYRAKQAGRNQVALATLHPAVATAAAAPADASEPASRDEMLVAAA